MGLDALLSRLTGASVTPVTPATFQGVQRKPLLSLIVTPVTPATPAIIISEGNGTHLGGTISDVTLNNATLHRQSEINKNLHQCPLCGGNLLSPGLDGCFHRSTLSDDFEAMEKNFD